MKKINIQTIKPLEDRVLIEPAPSEEKTQAGIIIPDVAKEKSLIGTVVALGDGKNGIPMEVSLNDAVLYGRHAGVELPIDGKVYLLMRQSDIFAVL